MKKICAFLLLFSLQSSFLFSCSDESGIEITEKHPRIHRYDHMATTAALISRLETQDDSIARLSHLRLIGILASNLISEERTCYFYSKTSREFSPFMFDRGSAGHVFCMFLSKHAPQDSIKSEAYSALAKTFSEKPSAQIITYKKNFPSHHRIETIHHESNERCSTIIPHSDEAPHKISITSYPKERPLFIYNLNHTKVATSMLPPFPPYPDHNLLILAAQHPNIHDDTKTIVKLWALPKKS